ncbi:hypothetical protein VNO77_11609 [Canavalia gladiata]|uniref:DUF4408 domain-containing protein n=1 Tax=Canavalia gladiata TaxID=3824 RepID=A0AAN9MBX7_CANGL
MLLNASLKQMESVSSHKLQAKKATTKPQKHHRLLRKIANLLRYVEVCVVLVLISRVSIQLPTAVKNSSEYFRNFMGSPRFVFLLGNVIIITLFAQSGHFSTHASATTNSEPDLYHQFLQNSAITQKLQTEENNRKEKVNVRAEKGKRIGGGLIKYTETADAKGYRRCQSDIIARVQNEKPKRVLQRSETERVGRSETESSSSCSYPEDAMSNDEFHRKVEAFIARQQRLRAQEHPVIN